MIGGDKYILLNRLKIIGFCVKKVETYLTFLEIINKENNTWKVFQILERKGETKMLSSKFNKLVSKLFCSSFTFPHHQEVKNANEG